MIKLKVKKIDGINFLLQDENKNEYSLFLSFYGVEKPQVGNVIVLNNENLLDETKEEYIGDYTFGDLKDRAGKTILSKKDEDVIAFKNNDGKVITAKRIYG